MHFAPLNRGRGGNRSRRIAPDVTLLKLKPATMMLMCVCICSIHVYMTCCTCMQQAIRRRCRRLGVRLCQRMISREQQQRSVHNVQFTDCTRKMLYATTVSFAFDAVQTQRDARQTRDATTQMMQCSRLRGATSLSCFAVSHMFNAGGDSVLCVVCTVGSFGTFRSLFHSDALCVSEALPRILKSV